MGLMTLVWRNLWRRKLRTLLTVLSLVVALFLLCVLRSLVTALSAGAEIASAERLVVQSAVSLFVELPLNYQAKIDQVPGVDLTCKWQWFGGYYRERKNFFAQFAVDGDTAFDLYPEMIVKEGSLEAWRDDRRGCVIGTALARKYGFRIGDTIPILSEFFQTSGGPDAAWEFHVDAIYRPSSPSVDSNMLIFHWKYLEETVKEATGRTPGVGTIFVRVSKDADPTAVSAAIDALFENGPQRVQTTSESEFQAQFVSMMGNVPFFLTTLGGGVLIAILLAVVNTMLMAGREQAHDIGILKALGFSDGAAVRLLVAQAVGLTCVGGGLGILIARVSQEPMRWVLGATFPGYHVQPRTLVLAAIVTLGLGVLAGVAPAWRAGRLAPVDALAMEE